MLLRQILPILLPLLLISGPVAGYDGITFYGAVIGPQDRVNSKGEALRSLREILKQDRANFHRFGRRDKGDQHESFFGTADRRALFDKADIRCAPALKTAILNGQVSVISVWVYTESQMEVTEGLPAEGAD